MHCHWIHWVVRAVVSLLEHLQTNKKNVSKGMGPPHSSTKKLMLGIDIPKQSKAGIVTFVRSVSLEPAKDILDADQSGCIDEEEFAKGLTS